MFLEQSDLYTAVNQYQLECNPNYDENTITTAIAAAVCEVKSYLSRFDTDKIFYTSSDQRDPLILTLTKTVAVWHLLQQSNIDAIHDNIKERYDRAITFLQRVQKGDIHPQLPTTTGSNGQPNTMFSYGSNKKFSMTNEY